MTVLARALAGLVFLLLVVAAACFVPAGTWRYPQAWTFLAVFGGCALATTLYLARFDPELLVRRVQAGPVAETRPLQRLLQALAFLLFIGIFALSGVGWRLGLWQVRTDLALSANLVVAAGFLLVFLVFRENTFTSATIEVSPAQTVVRTGPYRFVRHPMYSGATLLLLGTPPALGSALGWVAVLPLLGVIVARLLDEERYLARCLPGYREYCRQVPDRLVPRLW